MPRRPGHRPADGEQRQVVEALDQQVAQGIGLVVHGMAQAFGPVRFHGTAP
ncbi:hypothetical protein D3C80_2050890 [compost metagenome]